MKFSLKQLQVFSQTARFGNISRAADYLSMTQSAASTALKELERQFDIQLFDRVGKRLQINALGASIRPDVEALLEKAENLEYKLAQQASMGQLRIGATLTIANYLMAPIMAAYINDHEQAKIDLIAANTAEITEKILKYDIDLGLIEGEINHPDLNVNTWLDDQLCIFCSTDHPLANQTAEIDELKQSAWILREKGSGTRQIFERDLPCPVSELDILLELDQTQAIKQAVKTNLGIGCLSKIDLQEAFDAGTLAPIHFEAASFKRRLYIVSHQQKYITPALASFIEQVNKVSAS